MSENRLREKLNILLEKKLGQVELNRSAASPSDYSLGAASAIEVFVGEVESLLAALDQEG